VHEARRLADMLGDMVRKAITSCFTSASMASMRSTSKLALGPDRGGCVFGDHAQFGERIGGMRLDLEPDPEARFGRPDGGHSGRE
jgi:hypothetical protein